MGEVGALGYRPNDMFTIFAEYIFDRTVISYNFIYFSIRHLGSAI